MVLLNPGNLTSSQCFTGGGSCMFQLKEMVLALLIESDLTLTEDVVETIVDKTFTDADSKGDGRTNMHQMAARNEEPCLTKTPEDWRRTSKLIASDCNSLDPWNKKQKSVRLVEYKTEFPTMAEADSDLLVEVEGVVGDFSKDKGICPLMLERGPRWQCALHCLIDSHCNGLVLLDPLPNGGKCALVILSLVSCSKPPTASAYTQGSISINGVFHFVFAREESYIVSFDTVEDKFCKSKLPVCLCRMQKVLHEIEGCPSIVVPPCQTHGMIDLLSGMYGF
ncbi:hypothetical protein IFM89_039903 [Coptis chinensis]|uniref:Uncharacterized protein n=1 Tax=Coptis chinensis TaxID=261450 RepID=A0A835GVS6_9MAGN|nr:hypothetical protein IFM89_039903 [Coptis chinensis]